MDDLEFVNRCIRADKQAWEEFIGKYCRLIYSYIYGVLKIRGSDLASSFIEDIYQEVISSLLKDGCKKLKGYKGKNGAKLSTWLRQVTVNQTIDFLRKQKNPALSLEEPVGEGLTLREIIPYRSIAADEELIAQEKLQHLVDCIQQLSPDDKFFIELHIHCCLTLEQLKDFFVVSRGAVDMRKFRIMGQLRDCFRKKGFGEAI